ncbi:calcineurin catalytic subunit [Auricularia subglabra TFB-10046 SS5]|nr:calcineurin catalytic subunit [Auricularia subglabra TFB-10046 SS5]
MSTRNITGYPQPNHFGFLPQEVLDRYVARARASTDVPPRDPPTDEEFFLPGDPTKPNVAFLRQHFLREGCVTEDQALFILNRATEIFRAEPNVLQINSPINVCGDIHGQYYDLHQLLRLGGTPENRSYLFLGDYVDRGNFGIECVLFLWALKICHPKTFFLLRGNHECQRLTSFFTFRLECARKYSSQIYDACVRSFRALPLAAVVDSKYFCVHGGLSPQLVSPEDILQIDRFGEPPSDGLMCDLLWSDPHPLYTDGHFNDSFQHNPKRGCSFFYTPLAVRQFLQQNKLTCVIRAHEHQATGYCLHWDIHDRLFGNGGHPKLLTVFSAPNYMDTHGNQAAFIRLSENAINVNRFVANEHPYWLPGFMNAFDWSATFVAQKVKDMILLLVSEEEMEGCCCLSERSGIIHKKVLAVGRWARIYAVIHEKAESGEDISAVLVADVCMESTLDDSERDWESGRLGYDEDIDTSHPIDVCEEELVHRNTFIANIM